MARRPLAALALVALAAPAAAQSERTLAQRLDSIAGYWVEREYAIGIAAAVVRGGDTLLLESYGRADVEWDVPMPLDALFVTGSITKSSPPPRSSSSGTTASSPSMTRSPGGCPTSTRAATR